MSTVASTAQAMSLFSNNATITESVILASTVAISEFQSRATTVTSTTSSGGYSRLVDKNAFLLNSNSTLLNVGKYVLAPIDRASVSTTAIRGFVSSVWGQSSSSTARTITYFTWV